MQKPLNTNPNLAELAAELPAITEAARHPATLILTGLAAMWAGVHTGQNPQLTLTLTLFAYFLSLLIVTDLKRGILPTILTGILATLGTVFAPTLGLTYTASTIGAVVAFGSLLLCSLIAEKISGRQALGGGDLWLALALGAWLGAGGLPMLLLATAATGMGSLLLKRWLNQNLATYTDEKVFPFGPALCLAGWLALLYAPAYWHAVAHLTGTPL